MYRHERRFCRTRATTELITIDVVTRARRTTDVRIALDGGPFVKYMYVYRYIYICI